MVTQSKFLSGIQQRLKDSVQASIVMEEIRQLREEITRPEHMKIFVSTDITKVATPIEPWKSFPSLGENLSPR